MMQIIERSIGSYLVSTDPSRVDLDVVVDFLHNEAYWALGRPREVIAASIEHSHLVAGVYADDGAMVGFARAVTDLATFAWICDVFVSTPHRGHGLGVAVVETLSSHPSLASVKRQMLATRDAHALYERLGFTALDDPTLWMTKSGPGR